LNREKQGFVDALSNMKDAPVFVYSGKNDKSMPPTNQKCQKDLVEAFGAKTKYVIDDNQAHGYDP